MPIFGDKQVTSITVKINQLLNPRNDEIDQLIELYLSDLIDLIQLQPHAGPVEAARAVRKQIKYGDTVEHQVRALNVLELLVLNLGRKIGPVLARDDKLLDVLKGILDGSGRTGLATPYDKQVVTKVKELAIGWKLELEGLDEYKYMAGLYKFIPRKKHTRSASNVFGEASHSRTPSASAPPRPTSPKPRPTSPKPESSWLKPESAWVKPKDKKKKKKSKKKGVVYADKEYKIPQINYRVEAPKIRTTIADCHTHVTALNNHLITLPAGVSPLDDKKTSQEFDKCRSIRRKVLRYLQYVGAGSEESKTPEVVAMDEEFLGSLIGANEQLVAVFQKFDTACGYTVDNPAPNYDDEDSDESYYTESDDDDIDLRLQNVDLGEGPSRRAPPPRPVKPPQLSRADTNATVETTGTTESDPFGDSHVPKSVYF